MPGTALQVAPQHTSNNQSQQQLLEERTNAFGTFTSPVARCYILRWFYNVSNALFMIWRIWGFSYWRFTSSSLFLHCGCPCPPFVKNMKLLQNVMPTDLLYFVQLWVVRLSSISNFCLWFTSHQLMYNKNIQIHTNIYHILYMRDVSHQDAKHTTTVKLREWSTDMLLYKFRTPSIETGPWLWQWLPLEWRDLVLLLSSFIIFCLGIAETNSGKSWQSSSHDLFCFQSQSKQRTNMDQYSTFKIFQSGSRHHWARVFSAFSALSINRNASPWRWKAVVAVAPPSFVGQFDAETSICQHSRRARSTSCKYLIEHDCTATTAVILELSHARLKCEVYHEMCPGMLHTHAYQQKASFSFQHRHYPKHLPQDIHKCSILFHCSMLPVCTK